jgi:hypothetical protein
MKRTPFKMNTKTMLRSLPRCRCGRPGMIPSIQRHDRNRTFSEIGARFPNANEPVSEIDDLEDRK